MAWKALRTLKIPIARSHENNNPPATGDDDIGWSKRDGWRTRIRHYVIPGVHDLEY